MAVTITRTAWTDDDGSGTTGTVINNAVKMELYTQIDAALALLLPLGGGTLLGNLGFSSVNIGGWGAANRVLTIMGSSSNANGFLEIGNNNSNANDDFLGRILFIDGTTFNASIAASRETAVDDAYLTFTTRVHSGANIERLRITSVGNCKIAGAAKRGTTEGTNHLDIFDGGAPVGTLANGVSLYSAAGKLWVMNAAGTATQLSA